MSGSKEFEFIPGNLLPFSRIICYFCLRVSEELLAMVLLRSTPALNFTLGGGVLG